MNQRVLQTGVLIVGAGPSGLGVSAALQRAGVIDQMVIDAREIGASFKNWPRGMSLLTPSFHSNPFGLTDLNAISPETSPADFIRRQHPEGHHYARYLEAIANQYRLPVRTGIEVSALKKEGGKFIAATNEGEFFADYVVWAAGQFFHPRDNDFDGAHLALHSSKVKDWSELEGDEFTVIGGYESGVDAALNLATLGKSVKLISKGEPWSSDDPDPSRSLSPRTLDRLRELLQTPEKAEKLELVKDTEIRHIEKCENWWSLRDQDDIPSVSWTRPILANGFESGLGLVESLFDRDENGLPIFSEESDESTITPGLFYSGPSLVHRNSLFCFIYKFRARFGVIAHEIASRLGKPDIDDKLMSYLKAGFMNEDLDCCTDCKCAIEPEEKAPEPAAFSS
ncbi:MAG: NAD(P)/FAD-dependent oxidoreductase [Verrucomicrobiota bacterium]